MCVGFIKFWIGAFVHVPQCGDLLLAKVLRPKLLVIKLGLQEATQVLVDPGIAEWIEKLFIPRVFRVPWHAEVIEGKIRQQRGHPIGSGVKYVAIGTLAFGFKQIKQPQQRVNIGFLRRRIFGFKIT